MNLHEIEELCREFKKVPAKRSAILDYLRKKGQGRIADQLLSDWRRNASIDCRRPLRIKKKGLKHALGGFLGSITDARYRADKKNIEAIKKVMLQSISDMLNPNMSSEAHVLALKNFEESRSTLEDTAKNFPDERIRKLAIQAAQEVLNSKKAKEFFEKGKNQGQGLGHSHSGVTYLGGLYGSPSWM